jgi:hypothetical protein
VPTSDVAIIWQCDVSKSNGRRRCFLFFLFIEDAPFRGDNLVCCYSTTYGKRDSISFKK